MRCYILIVMVSIWKFWWVYGIYICEKNKVLNYVKLLNLRIIEGKVFYLLFRK